MKFFLLFLFFFWEIKKYILPEVNSIRKDLWSMKLDISFSTASAQLLGMNFISTFELKSRKISNLSNSIFKLYFLVIFFFFIYGIKKGFPSYLIQMTRSVRQNSRQSITNQTKTLNSMLPFVLEPPPKILVKFGASLFSIYIQLFPFST